MVTVEISVPEKIWYVIKGIVDAFGGVFEIKKIWEEKKTVVVEDSERDRIVDELGGCLSLPKDYDYKEDYRRHLLEKYE